MIKKSFSIAFIIIGTVIGAGFASGKELASFFGGKISLWLAPVCGLMLFIFSLVLLLAGKKSNGATASEVNAKMLKKLSAPFDIFLLVNNFIILGAMISAADSLFLKTVSIPKTGGAIVVIIAASVVKKGTGGMERFNSKLIPAVIFIIVMMGLFSLNGNFFTFNAGAIFPATAYVSLNTLLLAGVLYQREERDKKVIFLSSFIAGIVFTLLMAMIILMLNSGDFSTFDLPVLEAAKAINPVMYILIILMLFACIFTTVLSALTSLSGELFLFVKSRNFSLILSVLSGLILAQFSFSFILSRLYPIIGGIGAFYIVVGTLFVLPLCRAVRTPCKLFKERHYKVHTRRKHTQNNR